MSRYTTGELAKLCNISVRTVQYYDTRGILLPSDFSEGGRRLYTEADLGKLRIICFLRELGLPIESIKGLFEEAHPENVITLLLEEQEQVLRSEMEEKQRRVGRIQDARRALRQMSQVSVESIGDIVRIMENKKQLKRLHGKMLAVGFAMDTIQVSTLMLGVFKGIWLPFALGMAVVLGLGVYISALYFENAAYICPECHKIFRPRLWQSLWARHTPNTRKLTCIHCGHHGFCVETYGKESEIC